MNYRISDEAQRDLAGIGLHIAQDNPTRALSFVDEITEKFPSCGRAATIVPSAGGVAP